MLKVEKKVIDWIDKHMLLLAGLVIIAIAVLIRRGGLWHSSFDSANQFYTDAPGYFHTPFYTALIRGLSYIPITPLRTLKIVISFFDIGTALLSALVIMKRSDFCKKNMAALVCFAMLLISPLVIANGLIWLHVDSICMFFVLCAIFAKEKKHIWIFWLLLGGIAALSSRYIVVFVMGVIIETICGRINWKVVSGSVFVFIFLNVIGICVCDLEMQQSLIHTFGWLWRHPDTGENYSGLISWIFVRLADYGYLLGVGGVIVSLLYQKWIWPIVALHIVLSIYLGQILQYGYWF